MIPSQQIQGLLLSASMQFYRERRLPSTHMRSMFVPKMYGTTEVPLTVQRMNDYAAVDVMRGTNGNMNTFSKWTQKNIVPPEYHEKFSINALRSYSLGFGQNASTTPGGVLAGVSQEIGENIVELDNMIVRAEEIQCIQALETGIVVLKTGDNVDYKRKADSLLDGTNEGGYWTTVTCPVEKQLQQVGEFIREEGANLTATIDATMSTNAWIALQATDFFQKRANYRQLTLMAIGNPQGRNGANYHGTITAGSFIFNIWTYDATYTTKVAGVDTRIRLTDETKVVFTPTEGARFELSYGAVDTIVKSSGASNMSGVMLSKSAIDRYVWDSVDTNARTHTMHISSSPLARLITVDMVVTLKVADNFNNPIAE